ncbi:carbohydrate sulfotransferase 8-like [Babylonia areolata]|uniref:carbohydrate sulfotransferase 8-like n=1 Tax=Babylonia areolata TaxID=304850 RepID=UPI003FD639B3
MRMSTGVNVTARFLERRRRLQEVCRHDRLEEQRPASTRGAAPPRFLFPTTGTPTVLYCPVPRVGTTLLRRVIALANGMDLAQLNWKERFHVRDVVEGYDKAVLFFFTREPYSRLLSSYINTLWMPNNEYWMALGAPIVGALRQEPTMAELACGSDVTFPELVRYVILSMEIDRPIKKYFAPSYRVCQVCNYDYDFIGHMETFSEDATHILSAINLSVSPQYAGMEDNEHDIINNYAFVAYLTIATDKGRCTSKYKVLLRTWRALQIRGLLSRHLRFSLQWEEAQELKRVEFRDLLHKALNKSKQIFRAQEQQIDQSQDAAETSSRDGMSAQLLQRKMALASAWVTVPMEDREKIRELFDKEFKLFGYDPFLEEVFAPEVELDEELFDLNSI